MPAPLIRKYYDKGPTSINTTNVYTAGATGWDGLAVGVSQFGVTTAGYNNNGWISDLAQSDDSQGRVGQSIALETLDLRIKINWDLTATVGTNQYLRCLIVADQECDGTNPLFTEVLGPATTAATGIAISFLQPGYFGRFKVFYDEVFTNVQTLTGTLNSTQGLYHERHIDMKDHRVMWDQSNASAIANARQGHLFMFFFYEAATVAGGVGTIITNTPPAVQYVTRLRYRDM